MHVAVPVQRIAPAATVQDAAKHPRPLWWRSGYQPKGTAARCAFAVALTGSFYRRDATRRSPRRGEESGQESTGKFYQLDGDASSDAVPAGFGPRGAVVGGWSEDELEFVVAPLLEDALADNGGAGEAQVPVRVLGKADMERTLEEVLSTLHEMDAVLPELGDELQLENPVVLFSGWEPQRMINAVRQLRSLVALRKVHREPMSAMVVPRAMPKKMSQLVDEIRGDFELNRRAT
ncbi:hypothetical protein AK812_SmicGene4818 [Symbiodinium microadriaticum]|uniref:Uncharacterized protein n=1 Tax=Symbiodinium microadriaticum TaxID=2951 RepID=A0A1Q9EVD5_SYMMI|nr:hypothetical protein AK812_SmicGene4818 [Symbiodinium microadriaticum]